MMLGQEKTASGAPEIVENEGQKSAIEAFKESWENTPQLRYAVIGACLLGAASLLAYAFMSSTSGTPSAVQQRSSMPATSPSPVSPQAPISAPPAAPGGALLTLPNATAPGAIAPPVAAPQQPAWISNTPAPVMTGPAPTPRQGPVTINPTAPTQGSGSGRGLVSSQDFQGAQPSNSGGPSMTLDQLFGEKKP